MSALKSGRKLTEVKAAIVNSKSTSVIKGLKSFFSTIDKVSETGKAIREVGKAAKYMRVLKGAALAADIAVGVAGGVLIEIGIAILVNGLAEMYRRFRHNRQAVVIMPIKYRGRPYTAGIKGHKGIIYGEAPGRLDKWFEESWLSQLVDSLLFDEDKNPSLRRKITTVDEFLNT
jgi:hypothetical protein